MALGALLGCLEGLFQGGWLLLAGLAGAWLWFWRWGALIWHLAVLQLLEEAVAQCNPAGWWLEWDGWLAQRLAYLPLDVLEALVAAGPTVLL